jgi:hypothetical protein
VIVGLATAGAYGYQQWQKLGVAADVTEFAPADAEAILWIPRVDEFTQALLTFSRGIQEAERLRELLKPETGVDLGDSDGLRAVGVDPEAGLVVFTRKDMPHVLFGVEDAETFTEALRAKFVNMGHPAAVVTEGSDGLIMNTIPGEGGHHAAFAAHEGLLVLVYRTGDQDPEAAVRLVLAGPKQAFFASEQYKEVQQKLGDDGLMIWASGDRFARHGDGAPNVTLLDSLKLHPLLDGMFRARYADWLTQVSWAGARMSVAACAADLRATVHVAKPLELFPPGWLLSSDVPAPDLGKLLPRDTVLYTRFGLDVTGPAKLMTQISNLTGGLGKLGDIFGLEQKPAQDPVAALLSKYVHPQLSDRHVVRDVLDHLTGHVGVAFAGVDRKARPQELIDIKNPRRWLGRTIQLIVVLQLKQAAQVLDKWWPKRQILGELGFDVEKLKVENAAHTVLRLQRNCGKNVRARIVNKKRVFPPCETYGLLLSEDLLYLTTGPNTLDRLYETVSGNAASLHGLTREKLAIGVLEHAPMTLGSYFSFDGLLKAIRHLNLPGGATRYLAQMYELVMTLDTQGGDLTGRVLLTR